jgi:alkanesulfonate monooxygenase SsuD/methylene tetrahydromethanopterin reductase-like flavin-dependent oxidoreductase (luciferase family)
MASAMGCPAVAGFGPGAAALQASLNGAPYASPLTASREYLAIVRRLLDGDAVDHSGVYFSMHGRLPPLPGAQVELGLGVLRPRMARLAGEVADVAVTWMTPPRYLAERILPALRAGAAPTGRAVPRTAAVVPVALDRPDRDPVELALAGHRAHLSMPHYCAMLGRAGIAADPTDPEAGARALVAGGGFVTGSPDAVAEQVGAYHAAGVDEVVLNVAGVCQRYGVRAALDELKTVFDALAAVRTGGRPA